jgi:hypothetical protein
MTSGMKSAAIRRVRAVALVTLVAAGCASLQTMINRTTLSPAAKATVSELTPTPLETPRAVHRRRRHRAPVAARIPQPSPSPAIVNAPAAPTSGPSPTPAVMLAGTAPGTDATQRLIEGATKRLAGIDRSKLAASDAAAYDQARNMLASAVAAKRQGDDLAATGFAQKASALARSLPSAP